MKMMVMTISISIRVNPASGPRRGGAADGECGVGLRMEILPVSIFGTVQRSSVGEGIDVEHVVATPAPGIGVVLHRAEAPVGVSGHGVHGDLPQEAHLAHVRAGLYG